MKYSCRSLVFVCTNNNLSFQVYSCGRNIEITVVVELTLVIEYTLTVVVDINSRL